MTDHRAIALRNLIELGEAVLTMLEQSGVDTGSNQQTGDLRCGIDQAKAVLESGLLVTYGN